ncbi:MAG: hypothetical protein IT236_12815 [Bacteroidia bacterium]|nr:hypothetical protein [Bacteroidia bacterium]
MKTVKFVSAFLLSTSLCFSQEVAKKDSVEEDKKSDMQFTIFPPIGTNGIEAFNTTNRISINMFAGVSKGLDGIEVGGFANVILKDVKGFQGAGFANVVLHNVKGVQAAGFTNYSGGNFEGAALSGFCNTNLGDLKGGQFAGFCNANLGVLKGLQLSGFANYNQKDMKGIQGAGYFNINLGNFNGAQLSGFANVNRGDFNGIQASGFFNYARKLKGIQFGFINYADSVDGATIGFCNIVKKGLHQVEVSADEMFYTNVAVRTGTHKFYNIFSTGFSSQPKGLLWNIGYGVGTSFKLKDNLRTDVSLSAHHVSRGLLYHATSELYKLYLGVEYKIANKCYLAGGPTLNIYWGDALQPDYAKSYSGVAPYYLLNETNTYGFNYKAWVGGKIAIRFL